MISLDDAIRAQMKHAAQWQNTPSGDDDHDDCIGAYQLVADLVFLRVSSDNPEEAFLSRVFESDHPNWIGHVAVEGVCPELINYVHDRPDPLPRGVQEAEQKNIELPEELYNEEAEWNAAWCDQCGIYHSGYCPEDEETP